MKNFKTLFVIIIITLFSIGFQSCSAEELEIKEEQNTNVTGGKS